VAFTYDLDTSRGRVRLLISDVDEDTDANQVFTDDEIDAFLDLEGDNVRLAAALALETIARNEVMVSKVMRVLDLQTDGASVARELRFQAKELRDQAAELVDADAGLGFDTADLVVDQFTWRDRIWNEALRDA
jgi:hypothetical protein